MAAEAETASTTAISASMLKELGDQASVLSVLDEAEDVALDLHQRPFNEEVRTRAIEFLESDRYQATIHRVNTQPITTVN